MSNALSGKEALLGTAGLIVSIQMLGEVTPIATQAADHAKARVTGIVDTVVETDFDALPNPLAGPLTVINDWTQTTAPSLGQPVADMVESLEGDPNIPAPVEKAVLTPDDLPVAAAAMLDNISKEAEVAEDLEAAAKGAMAEAVEALAAVDEGDMAEVMDAVEAIEEIANVESVKEALDDQAAAVTSLLGSIGGQGEGVIGTRNPADGLLGSVGGSETIGQAVKNPLGDGDDAADALKKVASVLPSLGRSQAVTRLAGIDAGSSGSAGLIQGVTHRRKSQIHACYERLLPANPDLSGQLGIQVDIADGRVQSTRTSTNQTGNEALESCVNKRIRTWRFPAEVEDSIHLLYAFRPK